MIFRGDDTSSEFDGFLDAGCELRGELRFENTFRVDGRLQGSVVTEGELLVGEDGFIDGDVTVGTVYVSGTVKGTVQASRRLEVAKSGRLVADIVTPALILEEGAYFEGHCSMQPSPQPSAASAQNEKAKKAEGSERSPAAGSPRPAVVRRTESG